jgi:hypothetical protein
VILVPADIPAVESTLLSSPVDVTAARSAALMAAATFWASSLHATPDQVIETAAAWTSWLLARGASLVITPAPNTFQQEGPLRYRPTVTTQAPGGAMAVTMSDTEKVTLHCGTEDSKNAPTTGDTVTWTVDNAAQVTLTPSADGLSCDCAAGTPGTATVTATDGTLTGTEVFTIQAGPTTQLVLTADNPVPQ